MNPAAHTARACQPAAVRRAVITGWMPPCAIGATIRPSGTSWSGQAAESPEIPAVTMIRSNGPRSGAPSYPSARTTRAPVTPARASAAAAAAATSSCTSTLVTDAPSAASSAAL